MKSTINQPRPARRPIANAIAMALAFSAGSAGALEVTGSFTGWWDQPEQENHGVIVSVSRLPSGKKIGAVYWAHYDDFGRPSWLSAQGPIRGDTIDADVFALDGVNFMQPNNPSSNPARQVGSMQIEFSDCGNGSVSFQTSAGGVGSGSFPIARLTNQPGTSCSGGISDDRSSDDGAEEMDTPLVPTGVIPGASGEAKFEATAMRTEFDVEIEDVPLGDYQLLVGGEPRGMITVVDTSQGPEGEIEFGSPRDDDELLLDFDPRDQIIEILQGSTVVLEGMPGTSGGDPGDGDDGGPAFGTGEIEVDLVNSGLFPAGSGDAELEQESDRVDFEVEIEDVPVGSYMLLVGGVERGMLEVVDTVNGTEGEIEFRTPADTGKLPLDFDPRGELIELLAGEELAFSVDFPLEATDDGDDDDDDDDHDDGDDDDHDDGDDGDDDDDDDGHDDGDDSDQGEIEVSLLNAGVYPQAYGDAKFEIEDDGEREFDVEIEDLPLGGYDLVVAGIQRGTIMVVPDDDGNEGEIEFGDPADSDELPLDFDPRGQLIEVFEDGTLIFSVDFPNA